MTMRAGKLVTIGKAYSGLTDAEIADMTRWFLEHTISVHGRYRVVEPVVVVEVAFDVIMRSARHKSGFALRFPRIANLRPDKPVAEIDTLETVTRLYEDLQRPRRRAPGDRERQEVVRPDHRATPGAGAGGPVRMLARGRWRRGDARGAEMFAAFNELQRLEITLYTDALITHGLVRARQHRVTDILNLAEDPFLTSRTSASRSSGSAGRLIEAAFAQINLDAVLFAVATTPVEPVPELRTPKVQEEAIISIPPFRVTGTMHLLPSEGNLRAALWAAPGPLPADHRGDVLVRPRR